jgi:hypothetical protein
MKRNHTASPDPTGTPARLFWTEAELAVELTVTGRTLRNWRAGRIIPYIKIGRVVRYERASVVAALARQTVQARP